MTTQEKVAEAKKLFGDHHVISFLNEEGQPVLIMNGSPEVQSFLSMTIQGILFDRMAGRLKLVKKELPPLPPIPKDHQ